MGPIGKVPQELRQFVPFKGEHCMYKNHWLFLGDIFHIFRIMIVLNTESLLAVLSPHP